jgi:hypothetical protein
MKIALRVLSLLVGLFFMVSGLRWIVDPAGAADALGMQLQSGAGASTQIGDIGALFVAVAVSIGLAQRPGQAHWLHPAALLLGLTATMRSLAWLTGNADFTSQFIVAEVGMAAILMAAAHVRSGELVHPVSNRDQEPGSD